MAVRPNPCTPVCHSSPSQLTRYWITCLKFGTLIGWGPHLLTFQHVELSQCYLNLVGECQYLVFLVVYELHYFYFNCSILYLSNSWVWWISILVSVGPQLSMYSPSLAFCMDHKLFPLLYYNIIRVPLYTLRYSKFWYV